ncbi:MAG: M42 family metallopeptidase [Clostridia bacterium]|nr:M42 family metallopeptidase [Clostridia bacterium]
MATDCIELIRELSDAFGPSGFEDDVLSVIRKYAGRFGRIEEDRLRNLYVYRSENTGDKPVLMLDAHSDEVGLMVQAVRPNGTVKFLPLGGWNKPSLPGNRMLIRNAEGKLVTGIVAAKPVHFMTAAEKESTAFEIADLSLDVGAVSKAETEELFRIAPGDPIVPLTEFRYDAERGLLFGKAFDCRIGCAALIETLSRLSGRELSFDVVAVFSSQEEVGERGVQAAVKKVSPDIAVCFEGCPADDTFTEPWLTQTALRRGPMLRHMDKSVICNPRFMRWATDTAKQSGIPVQCAVREGGGNNGAVINISQGAVPVIVAGVPVRYIHSPNCIAAYSDFENTVRLAVRLAENMTPAVTDSF